jgi:hypothetical protein
MSQSVLNTMRVCIFALVIRHAVRIFLHRIMLQALAVWLYCFLHDLINGMILGNTLGKKNYVS